MLRKIYLLPFALALLAGCTAGKHKNDVSSAASSLNSAVSRGQVAVADAMYSNLETSWGTYVLDISSVAAFQSYDALSGYYTVQIYSNATRQIRYEDASGNALAVMGTASPFLRDPLAYGNLDNVRVLRGNVNVARRYPGGALSGVVNYNIVYTSGTVSTVTTIVNPVLTWLPATGRLSGNGVNITFSVGLGTGTVTDSGNTVQVIVTPTYSTSKQNYSFTLGAVTGAPERSSGPMAALGYGNE